MPQWSDDDVTGGEDGGGGDASTSASSRGGSLDLEAMLADEGGGEGAADGASEDRGSVSGEEVEAEIVEAAPEEEEEEDEVGGVDGAGAGELVDHDDYTDEEADAAVEELSEAATIVALMKAVGAVDCPAMKRLLKRADVIGCQDDVVGEAAILLEKCTSVKKALVAAVNQNQGEEALAAAVARATAIEGFQSVRVVHDAQGTLAHMRGAPANLAQQLADAVEHCEFRDLENLVPTAEKVGYNAQPGMGQAQALLGTCTLAVGRLTRATEAAMNGGGGESVTSELEKAIKDASAIPGFHDATLVKAETALSSLFSEGGDNKDFFTELEGAINLGDPEPISALLLKAKELKISPFSPTLRKANAYVSDYDAVSSLLEKAMQERTVAAVTSSLQTVSSKYAVHDELHPAVAAAKLLLKRLEVEESVLALLNQALQTKKQGDFTRAIEAAEAANTQFQTDAEEEAKALRKEAKQREAANLSGGGSENLTGGAARAAKALEKKILAASEKQASLAGGATYQVFNPPELAKAKDQKKLAGRLENDIVTATKRCAIDKGLPELMNEAKRMQLRTKAVQRAGSLLFRAHNARAKLSAALASSRGPGLHDWSELVKAIVYAKSKVHEKFTDPLIDEAVFSVARLKARAKHHRRVVHLTRTLAKAPLYFVPSAKNGTVASLKKRKGNPSNSSNSAVLNSDEAIKAEVLKGKVDGPPLLERRLVRGNAHRQAFNDARAKVMATAGAGGEEGGDEKAAASALDALLRLAVDEAIAEDDPTFGQLLHPESATIVAAENVLAKRDLLRKGMSSLLKVSEHDAADPSHAAILLGETQEVAQQLLELSQLDSESEEVKVARLAEAVLADDAEAAGLLLEELNALATTSSSSSTSSSSPGAPAASAPPLPPAAVIAGLTREVLEEKGEQPEEKDSKEGKGGEKGSPMKKRASATQGNAADSKEGESASNTTAPPSFEAATGFTLLHYAACHGSVKCLDLLCSRYGAHGLSIADPAGRTPLHVAAARGRKTWLTRALTLAHEHAVKEAMSNSGVQASEAELAEESAETMATLLARPDQRGLSLLHLASFHGRPLTAEWLVAQGASLQALSYGQQTPQALAKEQGHAGLAADLSRLLNDSKSPKKAPAKK